MDWEYKIFFVLSRIGLDLDFFRRLGLVGDKRKVIVGFLCYDDSIDFSWRVEDKF